MIQRVRPDVLLINEFDYAPPAVGLFRQNFLQVSQNGAQPIYYPYAYIAPSNTGVPSGHDLNNDGMIGGPNDAFGFGFFPGQFGMVVYSKYPINLGAVRTFQHFLWKDMPGALLPDDPSTPEPADWYSPEELGVFRLSSKSHWDVPIQVGRKTDPLPRQPSDAARVRPTRSSTGTASGTTTRSASGPTTSRRGRGRRTSTTTPGTSAGCMPGASS